MLSYDIFKYHMNFFDSQKLHFITLSIALTIILSAAILISIRRHNIPPTTKQIIKQQSTPTPISNFVTVKGETLLIQNQKFDIKGVNYYDLASKTPDQITHELSALSSIGVNTIRFWLFDDGQPNSFQPKPGIYNQEKFLSVDFLLSEAPKYNIKLIPTLINNWSDYGGKKQYLIWDNRNPSYEESLFYTSPSIKSIFEKYIQHILNRHNIYNNLKYSDDPSILAWDLMNEPRGTNQIEMNNWLISMSQFIKQNDQNHLVFAGTETSYSPQSNEIRSSSLCEHPSIDICSIHLYLYHDNLPLYSSYTEIINFIVSQKEYAKTLNKPLILGEFGIPHYSKPFGREPLTLMKEILSTFSNPTENNFLIWDFADTQRSEFTFTQNGDQNHKYSLEDLKKILNKDLY